MGGGGCGGGGAKESGEDDDVGCLEGLRGRRGGRGERRAKGRGAGMEVGLTLQHDSIKFTAAQLGRADAVLADIIRDDLPMEGKTPVYGSDKRCLQLP